MRRGREKQKGNKSTQKKKKRVVPIVCVLANACVLVDICLPDMCGVSIALGPICTVRATSKPTCAVFECKSQTNERRGGGGREIEGKGNKFMLKSEGTMHRQHAANN